MFVITEINEYCLPKIQQIGYETYEEAETAVFALAKKRGQTIHNQAGPEKAIEEWREGWVQHFVTSTRGETPNSWLISEVE